MSSWIFEVSQRFSRVDRKGRSAATSRLATLGICFGVMSLIVVMSIMNGFQMSFIDSILEISSYHVRVSDIPEASEEKLMSFCSQNKLVLSATPFYEAQTLMTGSKGKESAGIIRAISPDVYKEDEGFKKEIHMRTGKFDLSENGTIILGHTLARNLGVHLGDEVNLLVLSGGSDVELFSGDRTFVVGGTFSCGYSQINESYCFVNLNDAQIYFGESSPKIWGLKLTDSHNDLKVLSQLHKLFDNKITSDTSDSDVPVPVSIKSWRDYNKAFFGALRIEKNMLLLLVALIFVVVAINIYNGMRRLVFERRGEIAILSALGATKNKIKAIFVMRGFTIGAFGAFTGLILGIIISKNTGFMFRFVADAMYYTQYFFTAIFNPENLDYISENSMYLVYANIPARIFVSEVIMITIFGLVAPLFACWAASKNVLKLTAAEVLHNE